MIFVTCELWIYFQNMSLPPQKVGVSGVHECIRMKAGFRISLEATLESFPGVEIAQPMAISPCNSLHFNWR